MIIKNQGQVGGPAVHSRAARGSRTRHARRHTLTLRLILCIVFTIVTVSVTVAIFAASTIASAAANLDEQEKTALELNVELSRLGSSGEPSERETLLLRITRECPDVEAGQAAYWALSNLYLDDFDEPDEARARDVLERFLKNYPSSRWVTQVKCRLLALYERERESAAQAAKLRAELLKGGQLPNMMRATIQ